MRKKIKAGDRYHEWTALADEVYNRSGPKVKCRCSCGVEQDVWCNVLLGGKSTKCRKCGHLSRLKHGPFPVGKKFGKWEVVGQGTKIWKSICVCECGKRVDMPNLNLTSGVTTCCNKCSGEAKRGENNPKWKGGSLFSGTFFRRIIHGAKTRDLSFNITVEYLESLFHAQGGRCALTGIELDFGDDSESWSSHNKEITASVDRIDSDIGYEIGNIQWVHKVVNRIKMDHSLEELVHWCRLILEHQERNGEGKKN